MLEKQNHDILKYQNDDALLDLNTTPPSNINTQITQALTTLINNPAKSLIIQGSEMTALQAQKILDFLKNHPQITLNINLPEHLENTKIQIELDNLISNHCLEKNKQKLENNLPHATQSPSKKPEGRILPKGKIIPRIEITLHEELSTETQPESVADVENTSTLKLTNDLPKLDRSPIATQIVTDILSLPSQRTNLSKWNDLTNRNEARKFKKDLGLQFNKANHPLPELIKNNRELSQALTTWSTKLKFEKEQYNALLDVYGQYGAPGLNQLFRTWEEYTNDPYKGPAFLDTYASLLKYMPSFLPFIDNKEFQETLSKIANLSKEHRSWWMALIQNHGRKIGYSDLSSLFRQFTDTVNTIEQMGLTFHEIKTIKDEKEFPSTLAGFVDLLNKCRPQDQAVQWQCINNIIISNPNNFHFIIPEMQVETNLGERGELEWIKRLLVQNKNSNPELVKPAFYRYLATQEQHLPLEQYRKIIDELFSNQEMNNEAKIRMLYILAKSTSTNAKTGFDPKAVLEEWESFQTRMINLDSLERLKANRSAMGRALFSKGIDAQGGTPAVRIQTLKPIMDMPVTPPMSYLNKLLKLSEYKFLDPKLSLLDLQSVQADMMKKMDKAASLYKDYPESMMHAIRLIKTETIKANKDGQYFPEPQDITLLEQFISACEALTDSNINTVNPPELNPQKVLLPLLTTFHLEYENKTRLVNDIIEPYKRRLTNPNNAQYQEKIQNLLPYGLSLLQLIQNRDQPNKLNHTTLNKIQNDLMSLICRSKPTTKKEIREWMHENYGKHFSGTTLLDLKDAVNFSTLLRELECTQKETCSFIEELVSNFDNEEEKDQHEVLVRSLVSLIKILTPAQKIRFFEYCQEAFKTNGLLSRNLHPGPPSYLTQFKSLVDGITKNNSFDEFEQYMNLAQEHRANKGDVTNSLAKCSYLLDILYPQLMKQQVVRKEAFNFSAELVSLSLPNALYECHEKAKIPEPMDYPHELSELRNSISDLIYNTDSGIKAIDKLKKIQQDIDAILMLSANNKEYFKDCQAISTRITEIIKAVEERAIQQKSKTLFQNVLNYFWNTSSNTDDATEEELDSLESLGLPELVEKESNTYKELQGIRNKESHSFQNVVLHLHAKKRELIQKYSNLATRANHFISMALKGSSHDVSKNHNDVCQLIDKLVALDHQNLVLSLMYHYSGGLPDRDVNDLIELFNSKEYNELPQNLQKDFINAVITQMNNSVKCSKADVHTFLKFIHENKENTSITQYLHDYYQHAPFPPLSTFMDWIDAARSGTGISVRKVDGKYQYFDKHPCATNEHDGREKDNGFKLDLAKKTLKQMPEVQKIFTQKYLNEIENEEEKAKSLSTQQILNQLKEFKNRPPANHIKMVMLTAELLHRCKGRPPEFVGKDQIPGRSYELNTTQIIAILSLLETGNKVTAEIGTGEGKTRIMMILNACQFLKGKTVDFLTSNLALAERDYLESLPFFNSLGAEVNFITSSSKIEDYKMGGINVSDPENLCLFRNKAFSQNKSDQVLNKDPEKRALSLDEADVTYFDVANLKYNYSSTIPKKNIDLIPLFPLLMDFFAQSDTEKTYLENKQRCNEQLLAFVEARNPSVFQIIKSMPILQLEKWQDSAYTARHLEYNVDYTVVSDATSPTPLGDKKVAAAMCLIGSRISKNSNFDDGVHQCLHAELNRLIKAQNPTIEDPYLKEALEQCKSKKRVFNIDPIRKITFSSSSNTLLKAYSQGSLHAVTGTIGSKMEQREAQFEFGTQFIYVPRHKGIRRFDRPTRITQNETKQLDALVEHILESRAKNQPILLICKNDNESKILHDKLEERLKEKRNKEGLPKLTRIHAGVDYDGSISEASYIKNEAGKPGQVTITTEMEGRGVDIELKGKAHKAGLKVLLTYLPHGERDYGQIIGRSGRYGAIGETQMVLNLDSLREDFGINQLNTDFYLNPEDFIRKLQIFATHTKELRRLFHRAYDNYLSYFSDRYTALQTEDNDLTMAWSEFLEQYNHSKDLTLQVIEAQLEHKNPNINIINEQLKQHNLKAQELWRTFTEQLPKDKKNIEQSIPIKDLNTPKLLKRWLKELQQIKEESVIVQDVQKVRVLEHYDPTAAGSVQIVKNPSLIRGFLADIRAAWRDEGILFPNLRAWWAGQLSFANFLSQLPFFRWIITPKEETHIVEKEVPASHAILYEKLRDENENNSSEKNNNGVVALEPVHSLPLFQQSTTTLMKQNENQQEQIPNRTP
ncbi:coiled-coil protein [Legionella gratiana]|uniref:Coiled-coil protein n=1 Tax=Legionella gratiana TaxID=45066 RepID=A0A378JCR4_9GAMM|nr:prepilin peptidase [Legionella gratiana]KTD15531.1 coiled-coil protein [Legionella gratiana]STX45126.1 coiled-coil protein [Legionella gratiana]